MIPELVRFCERLFPSIDPYTAEGAKNALSQYKEAGHLRPFLTQPLDEGFQQGDIFSWVPFVEISDEGKPVVFMLKGLLLTNTCDCQRNDNLQFAAIWPVDEFSADLSKSDALRKNTLYQYLYYPDEALENDFIDFGLITSISRTAFEELVDLGKSARIATLSQIGYFMLLAKLTVFFMRPEDPEVNNSRDLPFAFESVEQQPPK